MKNKQVPKLRFPEFRNAQVWKSLRLGDLCEVITKGSTPTSYGFEYVNSGVRFVKIESLISGSIDCSKTAYITEECNNAFLRSQLKENDILFSIAGALGVIALVDRSILPANVNQAIGIVRLKEGPSPHFMLHQLQGDLIQTEIQRIRAGAAQPNISLGQLGDFAALLPIKEEQQKIADCLNSLDELIAVQARKVDALKTHKKGLMQQLFPREGETQPRLRFPEFRDAEGWESKLLSDLVKSFKTGKLDANAMVEDGQYRFYTCAKNYYQIDNYAFDGEALLVAGNGAHLGYIHHYIGKFNAYQRTYVLQDFKANVVFLRCLLDRYLPARILFEKKDGNTPYIVLSTLTEMPLVIPANPEEQRRIADCLTALDDLITTAIQELETLKTHKKGMMQQLFPSMEESV